MSSTHFPPSSNLWPVNSSSKAQTGAKEIFQTHFHHFHPQDTRAPRGIRGKHWTSSLTSMFPRNRTGLGSGTEASFWGLLGLIPGNLIFRDLKFVENYFLELTCRFLIYCWCLELWGQSYKKFYTIGRCKIKCLNCRFISFDEFYLINMLGRSVLTVRKMKI